MKIQCHEMSLNCIYMDTYVCVLTYAENSDYLQELCSTKLLETLN